MTTQQIIVMSVLGAVFLLALIILLTANFQVNAFLVPQSRAWKKVHGKKGKEPEFPQEPDFIRECRKSASEWMLQNKKQHLSIEAKDGIKLHALLLEQPVKSHIWALCIHGYTGDIDTMAPYARQYFLKGYNVLLPDNRAHGLSGGKFIGMGYLDKDDCILWIQEILSRDSEAQIIIHGESMGAATVMMLTGMESLPNSVKCAVADCGYTSVWEEFVHTCRSSLKISPYPLIPISSLLCRIRAGYSFKQASSIKFLKNSHTPTFFIHGGKDNFVPYTMLRPNYVACACRNKYWYVFADADHCQSEFCTPELYWGKVFEFERHFIGEAGNL